MVLGIHAVHAHVQAASCLADHLSRYHDFVSGIQYILRCRAPKNHRFPEGIPRGVRVFDGNYRTHDPAGNRLKTNRLAPAPADPYFCYFHFIILSAGWVSTSCDLTRKRAGCCI